MAGEAKTSAFMLSSATVMVGPQSDLYQLTPEAHSIGLVKNFRVTSDPTYTDLTQGVQNKLVFSLRTGNIPRASMEVYEYTPRNLSYALGLEGDGLVSSNAETTVTTPASATDTAVSVADETGFEVGDFITIQSGAEDQIQVRKVSAVSADTLGFVQPLPRPVASGAVVKKANALAIGSKEEQPFLAAKVVGQLTDGTIITLLAPKVRVVNGFSLGFTTENFDNMPFEFSFYDQVNTDPFFAQLGRESLHLLMGNAKNPIRYPDPVTLTLSETVPYDRFIFDDRTASGIGTAAVPVSGRTDPHAVVQVRVAGDRITPWQTVTAQSDGTWMALFDVPLTAGWMQFEARLDANRSVTATQTRQFGVGAFVAIWSQSSLAVPSYPNTDGVAVNADARVHVVNRDQMGSNPTGRWITDAERYNRSLSEYANHWQTLHPNVPLKILWLSVSGTGLRDFADDALTARAGATDVDAARVACGSGLTMPGAVGFCNYSANMPFSPDYLKVILGRDGAAAISLGSQVTIGADTVTLNHVMYGLDGQASRLFDDTPKFIPLSPYTSTDRRAWIKSMHDTSTAMAGRFADTVMLHTVVGVERGGADGTDSAHPHHTGPDGATALARETLDTLLFYCGKLSGDVPRFVSTTWGATSVTVTCNQPMTTRLIRDGREADFTPDPARPWELPVGGFQFSDGSWPAAASINGDGAIVLDYPGGFDPAGKSVVYVSAHTKGSTGALGERGRAVAATYPISAANGLPMPAHEQTGDALFDNPVAAPEAPVILYFGDDASNVAGTNKIILTDLGLAQNGNARALIDTGGANTSHTVQVQVPSDTAINVTAITGNSVLPGVAYDPAAPSIDSDAMMDHIYYTNQGDTVFQFAGYTPGETVRVSINGIRGYGDGHVSQMTLSGAADKSVTWSNGSATWRPAVSETAEVKSDGTFTATISVITGTYIHIGAIMVEVI